MTPILDNLLVLRRTIRIHGPVLALLLVLSFLAFGRLMTGDFWAPIDFQILLDAHKLSPEPWLMFQHVGAWFSQPLLQLAFVFEYRVFGTDYGSYVAANILLHALNAFIIYMLVNMLFYRTKLALLAAILFVMGVGNYGRTLQTLAGQEGLLLAFLHLLVLYLFIRNDYRREGKLLSPYLVAGLIIYSLTGLTKASTLSLLGCLVAYKAFFYNARGRRPIFSNDLLVFLAVGLVFQYGQSRWGFRTPTVVTELDGPLVYTYLSALNVFRYLHLMVFPLQESSLLRDAGYLVQAIYQVRVVIRLVLTLAVLSLSFFGFVFGSRPLRFFIAWTYITLIPFSAQAPGTSWLNLTHVYLASTGFCVALAAGTTGCVNLLRVRRWRRLVPFVVPLLFVIVSLTLNILLDSRNRQLATSPAIQALRQETLDHMVERPVRLQQTR